MSTRPLFVVAGVGNGTGDRVFSKAGYRVALIARNAEHLKKTADEINATGGEAVAFPVPSYAYSDIASVFDKIRAHQWASGGRTELRAALFNAGAGVWKPFLDVTEADVALITETNVTAAFAFARQVLLAFKQNEVDEKGKRGTLLFTGATASIRGNVTTSAFAAGKFALRALSQSLNKEFGKQNIHVAHAIIDGGILTDLSLSRRQGDPEWKSNGDIRLDPESIGKSYLYLANQDRSAWTWELDLRPAHEKW
ncbi:short-chain dehydrogenase/reductase SDR [Obba rivulosa]|uniref:Short-chain dehydrogenase/reductase SDR n=1 Tax=Obba rivulosa TaxID=1052685 RepID=A0A8E2B1A8_9APHY|nr:short-chain dehydrogenase/reductase SDR [Obba rivulosa]